MSLPRLEHIQPGRQQRGLRLSLRILLSDDVHNQMMLDCLPVPASRARAKRR